MLDVAGLYDDELFADPMTAAAAAAFRTLAATGTRFEDCWTESRDWPVTELQMLAGGLPANPLTPTAEDDPTVTVAPGQGLLAMPVPAGFVANPAGYDAWRTVGLAATDSLFEAAHRAGLTTALIGALDFYLLHVDPAAVDMTVPAAHPSDAIAAVQALAGQHVFAVVAIGDPRTADRHSATALGELAQLGDAAASIAAAIPNALVVVTSRGATAIDDPGSDFYGPGSSRHVPQLLVGPGVRPGVVSGQPASPADLPATVLYALGAATRTDVALGTTGAGPEVSGIPQPSPAAATQGRALLRAFLP